MSSILKTIGLFAIQLAAAVAAAIITNLCGGSDFLCGAFSAIAARAAYDILTF